MGREREARALALCGGFLYLPVDPTGRAIASMVKVGAQSFQVRPRATALMLEGLTPNALEMDFLVHIPVLSIALIALTSSDVNLALGLRIPRLSFDRPFRFMSAMFSCCVPRNRWSGFTQGGLSQ